MRPWVYTFSSANFVWVCGVDDLALLFCLQYVHYISLSRENLELDKIILLDAIYCLYIDILAMGIHIIINFVRADYNNDGHLLIENTHGVH